MKKSIFSSLFAVLLLMLCQVQAKAQNDKVYSFVSLKNPPTYPGGLSQLYSFFGREIKYPAEAVKNNIQGNVFVSFIVEEDGSVTNIKIDRSLGGGTDEEAIRVLKLMKRWNPGTYEGSPIRTKYNIPIKFTLNSGPNTATNKRSDAKVPVSKGKVEMSKDNTVYNFVSMENPPTYPGGIEALYDFIGKNIKYPEQAVKEKIQGNVFLSFVVGKDGSISNIKVDRKLGGGTDEEAIRVLRLAKRWNPGLQNGKAVSVVYNIPIKFSLTK